MVVLDEVISGVPATWVKCPCYLLGDDRLPRHLQQEAAGPAGRALSRPCGDCLGQQKSSRKETGGRTERAGRDLTPKSYFNSYLHRVDPTVFGSLQKLGWFSVEQ